MTSFQMRTTYAFRCSQCPHHKHTHPNDAHWRSLWLVYSKGHLFDPLMSRHRLHALSASAAGLDLINSARCRSAPFAVYVRLSRCPRLGIPGEHENPRPHWKAGLFKWLTREEWRVPFNATLDRHLRRACDTFEIEADEIVSILGESCFMTTVWGCAFEDFLTQEADDAGNLVDDYLKRRGWKESASNRAYMQALRNCVVCLYEVSNIVPETSFLARDLVRGGEPLLISERSATRSLKQWDRIAARVLPIGSKTVIGGAVLPFTIEASETLLKILRSTGKRAAKERHELASLVGGDPDDPRIAQALSDTVVGYK